MDLSRESDRDARLDKLFAQSLYNALVLCQARALYCGTRVVADRLLTLANRGKEPVLVAHFRRRFHL